jgi:hypothetical protein
VFGFVKELLKIVGKLRKVLAFSEGAVKKAMASIEMCWYPQTELLISVGKLRNVSAFAKGAVKQVFPSLEMCWQLQKEGFLEGAVKTCWQAHKCVGSLRRNC